jgi:hypothetical protein
VQIPQETLVAPASGAFHLAHQKVGIKQKNDEADFDDGSPDIVLHVAVALRTLYAKVTALRRGKVVWPIPFAFGPPSLNFSVPGKAWQGKPADFRSYGLAWP